MKCHSRALYYLAVMNALVLFALVWSAITINKAPDLVLEGRKIDIPTLRQTIRQHYEADAQANDPVILRTDILKLLHLLDGSYEIQSSMLGAANAFLQLGFILAGLNLFFLGQFLWKLKRDKSQPEAAILPTRSDSLGSVE